MDEYNKHSIANNLTWKMLERGSSLVISVGITIILSRLLRPDDFGLLAMINVFVVIIQIFVTSGLGNALIQKKDVDQLDFSTMFWLNIGASLVLYLLIFVCAPYISIFYEHEELTWMLRILGLQILITSINSIQSAFIARNMLFKFYFKSTFIAKLLSGVIGVVLAFWGAGAWALISQTLSLYFFETFILWIKIKWRPSKQFSLDRAKEMYSFAWKIMLTSLIDSVRDKVRDMLIGKEYSSESLAFYDKGLLFPNTIITNIATSSAAVMFPVASRVQEQKDKLLSICRKWISMFAFFGFPLMAGMMAVSKNFIIVVLTEKWLSSDLFLKAACTYYAMQIIERPIREVIKSLGRSDVCLKMQVEKMVLTLLICVISININFESIAFGLIIGAFVNVGISLYYAKKILKYSCMYLISDIYKTVVACTGMFLIVKMISLIDINIYILLSIQICVGVIVYVVLSKILANASLFYFVNLLKEKRNSH